MIRRCVLALLALVASVSAARAHSVNFAVAFVTVQDSAVKVTLTITGTDIDRAAALHIADPGTGMVVPGWLRDAEPMLARYIQERTTVTAGDTACPLAGPMAITADSDTGVNVEMRFDCPAGNATIAYRSAAMVDFDPAARQAVMLWDRGDYVQVALLDADRTATMLRSRTWLGMPIDVIGEYVVLGIEHIFLGYDHIAFLIAVLLWARRLMTLVKVVTAFTVAHSITLSLAALDIVQIPSSIIEPAIAATIVIVALENFISRNVENRWMWTGPLGLIHGFGFASALAERGLPHSALIYSLASFNIGVEIGQIAIVSLVLPLMWLADRAMANGAAPVRKPALVYPFSVLVAALGLWWFAERTLLG
jgi:hydrogenase/urease accessory protein HupE